MAVVVIMWSYVHIVVIMMIITFLLDDGDNVIFIYNVHCMNL